ncbi:hypothetical protein EDC04DRAFT_3029157 [Pisolithus marmoratus]|nr:hypothetical protein EDC04DRAFT_3029157 [Pisolithus marmoratus]
MEPELAEDGCNWHTYGSWVLKAISEEGLMGHLDGSETRPATPKLLQEYGAGQTPRTNEERDVVTAWKTADNAWHQRAAMAHQYIIFGLPDSILMLCMHLDTPHETFAYLENRYGQIPRPESQKVVDEATQEHDMPSKQYVIEESAQSAGDSNDKPGKSPSDAGSSPMSSSDCAEIPTGHQEPKMEIIDVRHVERYPTVPDKGRVGTGRFNDTVTRDFADPQRVEKATLTSSSSHGNADSREFVDSHGVRKAMLADRGCQLTACQTKRPNGLPAPPEPPPNSIHSISRTVRVTHHRGRLKPRAENISNTCTRQDGHCAKVVPMCPLRPLTTPSGTPYWKAWPPDRDTKQSMPLLADSKGQHTERKAKRQDGLPASPESPPAGIMLSPRPYRVPHQRGRLKLIAEIVSNVCTRQNAYRVQVAPKRPSLAHSMPSKRLRHPTGGLWMMKIGCSEVRHARQVETRGCTYWTPCIFMRLLSLPSLPSKRFWNTSNMYWRQGVPPISTRNNADRPRNRRIAKRPPPSSGRRQHDTCTRIYQNGSPGLPYRSPKDLAHHSGTLRDPRRRRRIKTRPKDVSKSGQRGCKHLMLLSMPISPPRHLSIYLWNVANTYWRRGVPPGWMRNDNKLVVFKTAASRLRYKVKMSAHYVHFRNGKLPHRAPNTTKHHSYTTRTRSSFIAEATLVY